MDKKEARKRGYGDIWDVMLTDEESDESYGSVPTVPKSLLERTMAKCQRAAHFEIQRNLDPENIQFKWTMERLTGKPYENTSPALWEKALVKVLHAFGYYGGYKQYREMRKKKK